MTQSRREKQDARKLAAQLGIRYTEALRRLREDRAAIREMEQADGEEG